MKKIDLKHYLKVAVLLLCGFGVVSCSDEDDPIDPIVVNSLGGINAEYKIDRCKALTIEPLVEGFAEATFKWTVVGSDGADSLLSTTLNLDFLAFYSGNYDLTLTATKGTVQAKKMTKVIVAKEATEYSAYIAKVFDFLPAVGQFTNSLPAYVEGDTKETMIQKAEDAIKGSRPSMVSLGGFGGYVVFGFDHTVVNISGKRDFRVKGNAFYAAANPNPDAPKGGSCEPGIVMVAYDKNQNGKPDDDEWYEIAGSEYNKTTTIKNYEITYYKPQEEKPEAYDEYIKWEDNQGNAGYKVKNAYHSQSYYPSWVKEDKITFKGTRLPDNAIDESGSGTYWVLYAFDWGYVDNAPNAEDASAIDIDWAVDAKGNKIKLPGIDFVKVYNGINQEAGWLGEVSTEVAGAEDLHLLGKSIETIK